MLESSLQTKIKTFCKQHAILFAKVIQVGRKGWPDVLLILKNGVVLFLELKKSPDDKATPIQKKRIKQLKKQKANVYVIDTIEEVIKTIQSHL